MRCMSRSDFGAGCRHLLRARPRRRVRLDLDGEHWSALDTPLLELWAADRGSAGVIAIHMDGSVWRLQP